MCSCKNLLAKIIFTGFNTLKRRYFLMKVKFNTQNLNNNPKAAFDIFKQKITKSIREKENIDLSAFSNELHTLGDVFEKQNNKVLMNKASKNFAQQLVNLKENNLAGIIYSFLIKFNEGNNELVKEFATNALAIAKRFHDPVHIMARTRNLADIYHKTEPGSQNHLKMLYEEKRAIRDVIKNYDNLSNRHKTIKTGLKPIKNYEQMLSIVLVSIAKIIRKTDPKQAIEELTLAQSIISKYEKGNLSYQIERLLKELTRS